MPVQHPNPLCSPCDQNGSVDGGPDFWREQHVIEEPTQRDSKPARDLKYERTTRKEMQWRTTH